MELERLCGDRIPLRLEGGGALSGGGARGRLEETPETPDG